ncbi:structural protein [Ralstonia phage PQ43W]
MLFPCDAMTTYLANTVMKQYSNSATLLALLASFDQWCDLTQFSSDFLTNIWDITQAQGFGLDIWGRILGQSRLIQITPAPNKNFGWNVATTAVANTPIGTGNGSTTTFTVKGNAGTAVTPNSGAVFYVAGVATTPSSQSGTSVTFSPAPASGAAITWTGTFSQTGTNWKPWSTSPFYGGASGSTTAFPLQDTYFRKLLLVKAAANIASCDVGSLNALMRSMFGDRGRCYVGYDPAVPMHIGYHFEFIPTPVEASIIQSGLFPIPAGMKPQYIYQTWTYAPFGFSPANSGANPKYVSPWSTKPFRNV